MGDHLGCLVYQVQAPEVMIDAMQFILLVSIPLLHPCENHSVKWTIQIMRIIGATNTHGYGSYINDLHCADNPKNDI